ncbi:hypothetical protein G8A07_26110 [Roseateles sp. DAIF2]|uniref:hypothetical protein n=1 Tax=Roseateles sp. DAIF2 TaxID=2714952 RepID=UPI0018A318F3|nr:hypothetical protein [Roseateles sp. DAIF2]QPF76055.1 hypothetical protein G8A07_26110 [Roseateles sp. DAIF2]
MKTRLLLLLLGLALMGTLLLGATSFEVEPTQARQDGETPTRGLAALARLVLGNAS